MADRNTNQYLSRRPMVLGLAKVLVLALGQIPFVAAAPFQAPYSVWKKDKDSPKPAGDPSLWLYLSVAAALVLLGGAFAGLTIALMGQDEIYLQVIRDSGEGKEKVHAGKVLKLLQRGKHWVLVTLLLSNVITNETLPIVLDRSLGGGWPAVLGSTVLIVIFGEIVPQSICVRFGLPIGSWMSPFVLTLMYIMAPIAWPTAKLLDFLLGEDHGTVYKKAGLKTLVSLHKSLGESGQRLHADEVTIISAVLDLKEKSIGSIMTPMDDVFTLSLDDVLDEETMDDILAQGYSRVPVHHADNSENFVGMLLVKMLITYDPEDAKPVRDFALATLPETKPNTSCLEIVNYFQEGKSHMVLVSSHPGEDGGALGVVTLEDVIEELIGEEIIDESDVFVDIHKAIRRIAPAPRNKFPRVQEKPPPVPKGAANGNAPDLIDINEGEPLNPKALKRSITLDLPPERASTAQRRPSAQSAVSALSEVRNVKRSTSTEFKEHLKHLGPSNLASRPKSTRYAAVKIKPGSDANGSLSKSDLVGKDVQATRKLSQGASDYAGGIGEGLLTGGRPASDGVQALQTGYGTMSTSPDSKRPQSANKAVQADPKDLIGSADDDIPQDKGSRPQARTNISSDTIGELPSRARSRSPFYKHRGPARSGSITENIVDTNGIRKVVLDITSSSESNGDDDNDSSSKHGSLSKKPSNDSNKSETKAQGTTTDDNEAHGDITAGSKKKRRRRKKPKNGGKETEPLLSNQH